MPGVPCEKGCGQSLEITEGLLSRLPAMQQQVKEMGEFQEQRAVVQPNDFDRVKIEKKGQKFTLLRRITNSKVSIQRSFQRVIF